MSKEKEELLNKELEEAIKKIKEEIKRVNKITNLTGTYIPIEILEKILDYIEVLEIAVNNKYPYVIGGRTLYSRLQQLDKKDLIKAYLRLRNETEQLIKETENSIPKQLVEEKIEELKKKSGGNVFHIQQTINSNIRLLQELLEGK